MKPTRAAGLYGEVVSPWAHATGEASPTARDSDAVRALRDEASVRQRRFETQSPRGRN